MDRVQYYLEFHRKRVGLSQVNLAKELNISIHKIRSYEFGEKIPPRKFLNLFYVGINKYINEIGIIV